MHKGKIEVESNADPTKGPTYTKFLFLYRKVKGNNGDWEIGRLGDGENGNNGE